jgi:hypothetical protein
MDPQLIKELAGPIATVFAAAAAAFVAYRLGKSQIAVAKMQADIAQRNWETANERVVLELFEKRVAVYDGIRDVIGEVTRSGSVPNDLYFRYIKAIDRVPFLFGKEVKIYLETIAEHMNKLGLAGTMLEDPNCADRGKWAQTRSDQFLAVTAFYTEADEIFGRYIRAHQKVG